MVPLPKLPITRAVRPLGRATMVGVIEESGALPGWISLAAPVTSPSALGSPGLAAKSSISLLSTMPVPGTTTLAPNQSLSV